MRKAWVATWSSLITATSGSVSDAAAVLSWVLYSAWLVMVTLILGLAALNASTIWPMKGPSGPVNGFQYAIATLVQLAGSVMVPPTVPAVAVSIIMAVAVSIAPAVVVVIISAVAVSIAPAVVVVIISAVAVSIIMAVAVSIGIAPVVAVSIMPAVAVSIIMAVAVSIGIMVAAAVAAAVVGAGALVAGAVVVVVVVVLPPHAASEVPRMLISVSDPTVRRSVYRIVLDSFGSWRPGATFLATARRSF